MATLPSKPGDSRTYGRGGLKLTRVNESRDDGSRCECCKKQGRFRVTILGYPQHTELPRADKRLRLCPAHAKEWASTWDGLIGA